MNEIKEYKVYETSDGVIYKDKKEAIEAQKSIDAYEGITEFFKTFLDIDLVRGEDVTINVDSLLSVLYQERNELNIAYKGKKILDDAEGANDS